MKHSKLTAGWLVLALILIVAGLAAGLMTARPVAAGGWATVTVDELPGNIVAGQPFTIRFTVRQHGQTPLAGLTPTLTVEQAESGHSLKTAVHEMKQTGRYEVTMTLPEPGQWSWTIHTFGTDYAQPPLTAAAGPASTTAGPASETASAWLPAIGSASLLAAGLMVVATLHRPRRIWLVGAILFLLVALTTFGWQWLRPPALAVEAAEQSAALSEAASCPVSPTIYEQPAKDPNADPFGHGPWVVNEERSIWVDLPPDGSWPAGEGQKVMWIRPAGTDLVVDGRRLDGDAPPLEAVIPCCYPTGFQVTGLTFPAAGCWQVTATAGESWLDFTTWVTAAAAPELDGEALFVSKGCIQCHQNDNMTLVAAQSSSVGPNLTHYQGEAEFLRRWLADPPAVKPRTRMPNLGLNAAEIEALIVFLGTE
jgi:cytochrome c2